MVWHQIITVTCSSKADTYFVKHEKRKIHFSYPGRILFSNKIWYKVHCNNVLISSLITSKLQHTPHRSCATVTTHHVSYSESQHAVLNGWCCGIWFTDKDRLVQELLAKLLYNNKLGPYGHRNVQQNFTVKSRSLLLFVKLPADTQMHWMHWIAITILSGSQSSMDDKPPTHYVYKSKISLL